MKSNWLERRRRWMQAAPESKRRWRRVLAMTVTILIVWWLWTMAH